MNAARPLDSAIPDNDSPGCCRYVIQHHTGCGRDHFDLMLQRAGVLWTWQIDRMPVLPTLPTPAGLVASMPAIRIVDHRLAYLTYQGPIRGGRGQCRIVDRGRVTWSAVAPGRIVVELSGGDSAGVFQLLLAEPEANRWEFLRVESAL